MRSCFQGFQGFQGCQIPANLFHMNRRVANRLLAGGTLGSLLSALKGGAAEVNSKDGGFRPRYILSSAMYGKMPLAAVLLWVTAEAFDGRLVQWESA